MNLTRISASGYSNTAPLIWSFQYGLQRGKYELILDNAPARSAELLREDRVDAALVPVIEYQRIEDVRLVADVCVGAREKVRSVCLVTKGEDLKDVRSVALDVSSKTSVALTKIIFREFLGFEPDWRDAEPDLEEMLANSDCALLIGDPALVLSEPPALAGGFNLRKFDLAELWKSYTDLGFVFAMWMTRKEFCGIDFAAARDEGLRHLEEIISNYETEILLTKEDFRKYLSENISYAIDDSMRKGLELYFALASKNGLIEKNKPLVFI
jgi:chorismate dehydratase